MGFRLTGLTFRPVSVKGYLSGTVERGRGLPVRLEVQCPGPRETPDRKRVSDPTLVFLYLSLDERPIFDHHGRDPTTVTRSPLPPNVTSGSTPPKFLLRVDGQGPLTYYHCGESLHPGVLSKSPPPSLFRGDT